MTESISEKLTKIAIEKSIPLSGLIELTNKCNENCIHCYRVVMNRKEVDLYILKKLFDELKNLGTFYLSFSGGEIFLHKHVLQILEYAKSLRFYVVIKTNGLLLDKEKIKFLQKIGINRVDFSFYAMDEKIHDSITKIEGSHAKTLQAIENCKKEGLNVRINIPIMKHNRNQVEKLIKFSEKLQIEKTFDPFISPKLDGSRAPIIHRLSPIEIKSVQEKLKEYEATESSPDCEQSGIASISKSTTYTRDDILNSIPCSAGFSQFYVNSYGDVTPCVAFPLVCGNIFSQSFSEIWYKSQGFLSVRNTRIRDLPTCSKCSLIDICNRCPGNAFIETGNFKSFSPSSCEYAFADTTNTSTKERV